MLTGVRSQRCTLLDPKINFIMIYKCRGKKFRLLCTINGSGFSPKARCTHWAPKVLGLVFLVKNILRNKTETILENPIPTNKLKTINQPGSGQKSQISEYKRNYDNNK